MSTSEAKENGIQRAMRVMQEQSAELALWHWLVDSRLTVQENAAGGWSVLDVDNEVHGKGATPIEAIKDARRDDMSEKTRVIFSREHNAWWNPKSAGYTQSEDEAGRYTLEEAERICHGEDEFHYAAPEYVRDLIIAAKAKGEPA